VARTRVVRKTQRGTSIPELLVAMLVLLLGIWVVAAKFPKLTQIMRGERLRDQMARMAEQQLEKARDGVEWLPSQIAVYDPVAAGPQNVYGIDEALSPVYNAGDEPNWEDQTRPRNVVENTLLVLGETFRVPAPGPDATDPQAPYFLKCGPAELVWWVYQPIPLTRDDDLDPDTTETPLAGTFYAETGGTLRPS
jgi:type II secretory pathway pseudopilin PulG